MRRGRVAPDGVVRRRDDREIPDGGVELHAGAGQFLRARLALRRALLEREHGAGVPRQACRRDVLQCRRARDRHSQSVPAEGGRLLHPVDHRGDRQALRQGERSGALQDRDPEQQCGDRRPRLCLRGGPREHRAAHPGTDRRGEGDCGVEVTGAPPPDAAQRRAARPVIVYSVDKLPAYDREFYEAVRRDLTKVSETIVPPREACTFNVPAGHIFRIVSVEGPQVGDLNLWHAHDLSERFFSGKTRALHATHVTTGDRLWSTLPHLRPMATITHDTLSWYGFDADDGGVHDVIGTRCDPYTQLLLAGTEYHHCCHSNLTP